MIIKDRAKAEDRVNSNLISKIIWKFKVNNKKNICTYQRYRDNMGGNPIGKIKNPQ